MRQPPSHGTALISEGDNQHASVITIRKDGAIKRIKHTIKLDPAKGHLYNNKGRRVITAEGFYFISSFAPLAWIPVDTITNSDGTVVGNPHLHNGAVTVRKFAVGRAADGSLRAHDNTVTYAPSVYFANDMFREFRRQWESKAKCEWARLTADPVEEIDKAPNEGVIEVAPGVRLVYDLHYPFVLDCLKDLSERTKFADRFAATVCQRNIFKRHYGFSYVDSSNTVTVFSWEPLDVDLTAIAKKIVIKNGEVIIDGEKASIEVESKSVSEEDFIAAEEDTATDESVVSGASRAASTQSPAKEPPSTQASSEGQDTQSKLHVLRCMIRTIGIKESQEVLAPHLKKMNVESMKEIPKLDATQLQSLIDVLEKEKQES